MMRMIGGHGGRRRIMERLEAHDQECAEANGDSDEGEGSKGDEAASRPLDLGAAHGLDHLASHDLGLGRLPVLGCAERRKQDESTCNPEEGEH